MITDIEQFLAWEKATRDTIDFKKIYVDVASDVVAGLMLSEIVYWHLPDKHGQTKLRVEHEGTMWIAIRRYQWWERVRVSPRQADRGLAILEEQGLIARDIFKFNGEPTTHVTLVWVRFLGAMRDLMESPMVNPYLPVVAESAIPLSPIRENRLTSALIPVTETPTETTEKIASPKAGSAVAYGYKQAQVSVQASSTKAIPLGDGKVGVTDPLMPEIGLEVLRLSSTDHTRPVVLSYAQLRELCELEVATVHGKFPPPMKERESYPKEWAEFIENFTKMPYYAKTVTEGRSRLTVGLIIKMLRAYSTPKGWLDYRPKTDSKPVDKDPLDLLNEWSR